MAASGMEAPAEEFMARARGTFWAVECPGSQLGYTVHMVVNLVKLCPSNCVFYYICLILQFLKNLEIKS